MGERLAFSTNSIGTAGYPYTEEWSETLTSLIQKIGSKWIKDINVRAQTIKIFRENIDIAFVILCLGNSFLDTTPKVQKTREKNFTNCTSSKLNPLCFKTPSKKWKDHGCLGGSVS